MRRPGRRTSRHPPRATWNGTRLPRQYRFLLVPQNPREQPVPMPRRGTDLYSTLDTNNMIQVIQFLEGSNDYCVQQILDAFSSLALSSFVFYRPTANNTRLIELPPGRHNFSTFDLSLLEE
jgi:hypothetical protein